MEEDQYKEMGREMLLFINERGLYVDMVNWLEERGYDKQETEDYFDNLNQF